MRKVLIRLLLLALCFHTVIGMPAHEATHMARTAAQHVVERTAAASERQSTPASDHHAGADALCAWCLAFAHLSTTIGTTQIAAIGSLGLGGPPRPALDIGFVPRLDRWRFSSRDPPSAVAPRLHSLPS